MNSLEAMELILWLGPEGTIPAEEITETEREGWRQAFDVIMDRLDLMYCAEQDRIIIRQD
tara:strand:- start:233 stop:412 length:180 start_codon:yes stop_codon:yes gene_type:complete